MRKISAFGIIGVSVLLSVITILYLVVKANFNQELKYFYNIIVSTNLLTEYGLIIKESEFIRLANYKLYQK